MCAQGQDDAPFDFRPLCATRRSTTTNPSQTPNQSRPPKPPQVLRLVRSWDEFVFKRALPKTLAEPTPSSSTNSSYNKGGSGSGGNWRDRNNKNNKQQEQQGKEGGKEPAAAAVDPAAKRDRRPKVRAILLCGPPGACMCVCTCMCVCMGGWVVVRLIVFVLGREGQQVAAVARRRLSFPTTRCL